MIAHNLFRFDFWRTRDVSRGAKSPTSISFANIGNEVAFIDTIKYFQQSLAFLAKAMTEEEKETVNMDCR